MRVTLLPDASVLLKFGAKAAVKLVISAIAKLVAASLPLLVRVRLCCSVVVKLKLVGSAVRTGPPVAGKSL